ncbi:F-box/LRR-repeat protein 6 isoform X2 [Mauremys reevesii]|uniref:F-box/LRR-repeat protein 6 isoform X2 n=1 Tax=Mauremys reevesii TaxID=260615 RepID=UPI00193F40E1|nr:F-box/LRR-repeat protein 6 isoform X2 [Mauremys reevesii]
MEEPRTAENLREAGASSELSGTGQKASKKQSTKAGGRPRPGDASKASKKKAAFKAPRRVAPDYFVHETDNDMLLIIANIGDGQDRPPRKVAKRKHQAPAKKQPLQRVQRTGVAGGRKREKGGAPAAQEPVPGGRAEESGGAAGASWGERLPVEILVRIFQSLVASEGAVPLLCRVARVCRLWYGAASNPVLWQKVSIGFCWVEPGKKQPPQTERRILSTMEWLVPNRFSLLRDFALCHWKSHVPVVLQALAESCPLLLSLKLTYCSGVTTKSLSVLAERCPRLESLNLQNSQSGCCLGLRLLEVNTEIKQSSQHLQLSVEQLQAACQQLQVLRLLNVIWSVKPSSRSTPTSLGFPHLEELCLATTSYSFVSDSVLQKILQASTRLRVLDLRGCFRVTPKGLQELPCPDLEQLYLGLYCSDNHLLLPSAGSHLLTWKWHHSLQELDLAGQSFSEHDLERAMAAFGQGSSRAALRSLNLTGTKVTVSTVSALIISCPALSYLSLSSCRYLPRGMKKVYRGQDDIRQCLSKLLASADEPAAAPDTSS